MNVPISERREWIPAGEVARKLGYTRQHFARLCRGGGVPSVRRTKGGHWRINPTKEFAAWFDTQPRNLVAKFRATATRGQKRALLDQSWAELRKLNSQRESLRLEIQRLAKAQDQMIDHWRAGIAANHALPSASVTSSR